ncbi:MAG TPA: hypothetical protein VMW50_07605, partial [Dehalococcoidia bacterium]|nr:hypothetical protein [Dehalococcoidia bacterium]
DHSTFDEETYVPAGWIEESEADDASRLQINWTAGYDLGDTTSQFASWALSGIKRFLNCEQVGTYGTRGVIWIELKTISGTTRSLRLWANGRIVGEGSRTGDGTITIAELNASGLSGTVALTYSADIVRGDAQIDLRWPGSYNVHYSLSTLTYPRTPEAVVSDREVDNFIYLTPVLASGAWNYAVQAVGDDAIELLPVSAPVDSPKAIGSPPLPPSILGATGNAATGITLTWTHGQDGCRYWIHRGKKNEPVNLGDYPAPVPYITNWGDTSTSFTVPDWAATDWTTPWATVQAAFQGVVDALNANYDTGMTGFEAAVRAQKIVLLAAVRTFGNDIQISVSGPLETAASAMDQLEGANYGLNYTLTADWQAVMSSPMSTMMDMLSNLLFGELGRFTFTNGSLPFGSNPTGSPDGSGDDGTSDDNLSSGTTSLQDLVLPLVRNSIVWVIVRAENIAGFIETTDDAWPIEIDAATGDVIQPRPNTSWIDNVQASGLTLTVSILVRTDDQEVAPDVADFYSVAYPGAIVYTVPQETAALTDRGDGILQATLTHTVAGAGYYTLSSRARVSTTGSRSSSSVERILMVSTVVPAAATDVHARVIRGTPIEEQEGAA